MMFVRYHRRSPKFHRPAHSAFVGVSTHNPIGGRARRVCVSFLRIPFEGTYQLALCRKFFFGFSRRIRTRPASGDCRRSASWQISQTK